MKFKALTTRIPVADPDLQIGGGGSGPPGPLPSIRHCIRSGRKTEIFFLRSPKTYLSKMHFRLEIFKNAGFPLRCRLAKTDIWQALGMLCERCYRISILLAFSCGRGKNRFCPLFFQNIRIHMEGA